MESEESVIFFSSRRRHTRFDCDWSSDVCSSDLFDLALMANAFGEGPGPLSRDVHKPGVPRDLIENGQDPLWFRHKAAVEVGFELQSEEHTSELQSQSNLVCRLLLEKKKKNHYVSKIRHSKHIT